MSVKISTMYADDPITKDAYKQDYTSIHVGGPLEFDMAGTSYDDLLRSLGIRRDKPGFPRPKQVIYNPPATICLWPDGTKTVVKCHDGDTYSREFGLLACIAKHAYGDHGRWYDVLRDNGALDAEDERTSEMTIGMVDGTSTTITTTEPPYVLDRNGRHIHVGDKVGYTYLKGDYTLAVTRVYPDSQDLGFDRDHNSYSSDGYLLVTDDGR